VVHATISTQQSESSAVAESTASKLGTRRSRQSIHARPQVRLQQEDHHVALLEIHPEGKGEQHY
jgi:hypothetical protein